MPCRVETARESIFVNLQKTNSNVERALRFIATFAGEAPQREDESCSVFIQDLISELVLLSTASDKVVRIRACGVMAGIMQQLKMELQEETYEELQTALLGRLKDKANSCSA